MEKTTNKHNLFINGSVKELRLVRFAKGPETTEKHIELENEIDADLNPAEVTEEKIKEIDNKLNKLGDSTAPDFTISPERQNKFVELLKKRASLKNAYEKSDPTKNDDLKKLNANLDLKISGTPIDEVKLNEQTQKFTSELLKSIQEEANSKSSNSVKVIRIYNESLKNIANKVKTIPSVKLYSSIELDPTLEVSEMDKTKELRLQETKATSNLGKAILGLSNARIIGGPAIETAKEEVNNFRNNAKEVMFAEIATISSRGDKLLNSHNLIEEYLKNIEIIDQMANNALGITPASAPPAAPPAAPTATPPAGPEAFDKYWGDFDEKLVDSKTEAEMKGNVNMIDNLTDTSKMKDAVKELNTRLEKAKSPFRIKEDGKNILIDAENSLSDSDLTAIENLDKAGGEEGALDVLKGSKTGRALSDKAEKINEQLTKKASKKIVGIEGDKLVIKPAITSPDPAKLEGTPTGFNLEKIMKFLKDILDVLKGEMILNSHSISALEMREGEINSEIATLKAEELKSTTTVERKSEIEGKIAALTIEKTRIAERIKEVKSDNAKLVRDFQEGEVGAGTSVQLAQDKSGDVFVQATRGSNPSDAQQQMRYLGNQCQKQYPNCGIPQFPCYASHMYPTPRFYAINNSKNIIDSPGASING